MVGSCRRIITITNVSNPLITQENFLLKYRDTKKPKETRPALGTANSALDTPDSKTSRKDPEQYPRKNKPAAVTKLFDRDEPNSPCPSISNDVHRENRNDEKPGSSSSLPLEKRDPKRINGAVKKTSDMHDPKKKTYNERDLKAPKQSITEPCTDEPAKKEQPHRTPHKNPRANWRQKTKPTVSEEELSAEEVESLQHEDLKQTRKRPKLEKVPINDEPSQARRAPSIEPNDKKSAKIKPSDEGRETYPATPLGKKKPDPPKEEELSGDEIIKSTPKDPKSAFKKPQQIKRPDEPPPTKKPATDSDKKSIPKVKLPDDKPEAQATIQLVKKKPDIAKEKKLPADEASKPTVRDSKQAFKKPQPSKTPDEPTSKKKPATEPDKKNIPKVKLPDDEPEAQITIPLGKKKPQAAEEEELPADEISKPTPKDPK
ncbi:unnamed protein product, partial [Angiostrongylus costaricensis]|uniref:Muscle M-line assembly protein unc-89 n=1 Tax=Angiostrongylus costaricensis TaxID=334426 RepID=A0A0R3Q2E4_ANGCS